MNCIIFGFKYLVVNLRIFDAVCENSLLVKKWSPAEEMRSLGVRGWVNDFIINCVVQLLSKE